MVSQGNLTGASQLAKTPGVLKPTLAGSQMQHLGRGGEGLATMVAHPEHGVAVRKLYDPRGISGPDMIARKEQAGKALGDNPTFAKFLGSSQTPQGGQMHFNEYVPSGQSPTGQAGDRSVRHAQTQAQKGLTEAGFAGGKDIRKGNMIYDANAGQHRVIDYIPANKGEFMRMPSSMANRLSVSPGVESPFNKAYNPSSGATTGGMLGRLLGGKSQPGGIRESVGDLTSVNRPGMARGTPPQPKVQPAFAKTIPQKSPTAPLQPPESSIQTAVWKPPTPQTPAVAPNSPATAIVRKPRPAI